ncbi:MAG: nucleotide exchange factor GrpE [Verrucomicrobiota bacterium JB022]|nr:nucleotide exchange factor GrpE [Verrucomicrobiota bacterium JB022]
MAEEAKKTQSSQPESAQSAPEPTVNQPEPETTENASAVSAEEHSQLLQQLEQVTAEAEENQRRYLRAVADLENYRKRAMREKDEARRYGAENLAGDLLPVLDNFTLGLQAASQHEAGKVFAEGFAMVQTQIRQVLESNGIQSINPVGEAFDPHRHESLAYQPSEEVEEGNVIAVHRVGYQLHDRLLRPASVVVSSGPAQKSEGEASQG